MPGVGRHRNGNPVAALPADNVKRTADAVDGLVENEIVLKGVGPDNVVIIRISCPPDNTRCAVLGSGDGLELNLFSKVTAWSDMSFTSI
jgi:hypothetical protein